MRYLVNTFRSEIVATIAAAAMVVLVTSLGAGTTGKDYGRKPDWWDKIPKPEALEDKGFLRDIYWRSYPKTIEKYQLDLKDWYVVGPFDDNDGDPWEYTYGPEKDLTYHRNASFKGKGGKTVKWQKLEDALKDKAIREAQNCVFFLVQRMDIGRTGTYWLHFGHDDGAIMWIDKKVVVKDLEYRAIQTTQPFEINPKKGKYVVFVKLAQGTGPWGIELKLAKVDPIHLEIRILTDVVNLPSAKNDPQLREYTQKLAELYMQDKDYKNSFFWQTRAHEARNEKDKARFYSWLRDRCNEDPAMLPHAQTFYEEYFSYGKATDEEKVDLLEALFDLLISRNDINQLISYIDANGSKIKRLMPKKVLFYKLKGFIRKGDQEECNRIVKQLEEMDPNIKNDKTFRGLKNAATNMRGASIQLPIDWDYEAAIRTAKKLAADDKDKLHQFIRSTFNDRAKLVVGSRDPQLFSGALQRYRQEFQPYATAYNASLPKYLDLLKNKLHYTPDEVETKKQLLQIPPPQLIFKATQSPYPKSNQLHLPENRHFQPLVEMNLGAMEMARERNCFSRRLTKYPPAAATVDGNDVFLQNNREIVCLKGDKVVWSQLIENSEVANVDSNSAIIQSKLNLAVDKDQVYAKLLMHGRFTIVAFNRTTGERLWTFNEGNMDICMSPVVWRNQLVTVSREPGDISRYFILIIDPQTGHIKNQVYIMSSSPYVPFSHFANRLSLDYYMPAPAIKNDIAYLSTNYGIALAFDLKNQAFVWLRRYPKTPFAVSHSMAETMKDRDLCSPVAGLANVVVPAVDSAGLQAIDRLSGRLVAEETGYNWSSVHPFGNEVLVLTKNGAAYVLSSTTLKQIKLLPSKDYTFVKALADGAVLKRGQYLEIWTTRSKSQPDSRIRIPKDTAPITVTNDSVLAYQEKAFAPIVGRLVKKEENTQPLFGPIQEKHVDYLENPYPLPTKDAFYVNSDNYLLRLDDNANIIWATARRSSSATYRMSFNTDKYVYIVTRSRVIIADSQSGKVLDHYPRYGQECTTIYSPTVDGGKFYFMQERTDWRGFDLYCIEGTKVRKMMRMDRKYGSPTSIMNQATLFGNTHRDKIVYYKYDKEKKDFKQVKEGRIRNHWHKWFMGVNKDLYYWQIDRDAYLFDNKMNINKLVLHEFKGRHYRPRPFYDCDTNVPGYISRMRQNDGWNIIDLKTKKDLGSKFQTRARPVFINNKIFGVVPSGKRGQAEVTPVQFDLRTMKKTQGESLSLYSMERQWTGFEKDYFSVNANGKSYQLLRTYRYDQSCREGLLVIQDGKSGKVEYTSFPSTGQSRDTLFRHNKLMLLQDKRMIVLDKGEIDRLAKKSDWVFPAYEKELKIDFDGYPDEWPTDQFHSVGPNSFALAINKKRVIIAGYIRNEAFINALGSTGLEGNCRLVVQPGPVASFIDPSDYTGVYAKFTNLGKDSKFAYSVKPSGDELFFELEINGDEIFRRTGFSTRDIAYVYSRDKRGDIAFDILFTGPDGKQQYAFASKPYGAYFPRALITSIEDPREEAKRKQKEREERLRKMEELKRKKAEKKKNKK